MAHVPESSPLSITFALMSCCHSLIGRFVGLIETHLVAPCCAIPRDYLRAFWRLNMANWVRYPLPPFLSVSPLQSMPGAGAIPPPQKGYLSDTGAIPYENKANVCDTPLCDTISKGYCAIGGVSRAGPLRKRRKAVALLRGLCSQISSRGVRGFHGSRGFLEVLNLFVFKRGLLSNFHLVLLGFSVVVMVSGVGRWPPAYWAASFQHSDLMDPFPELVLVHRLNLSWKALRTQPVWLRRSATPFEQQPGLRPLPVGRNPGETAIFQGGVARQHCDTWRA